MGNYSLKRKLSWFMLVEKCPYSGLEITHPETLVGSDPKTHYSADIAKLGKNLLILKPYGYSTALTGSELVAFIDDFIVKHFTSESGVSLIEDCVAITGAAAESRKQYITYFKNNDFVMGLFLYQLPPILKISFNLAKKLHIFADRAHAVSTYEQAVDLARKLNAQKTASNVPDTNPFVSLPDFEDGQLKPSPVSGTSGFFTRMFATLKGNRLKYTKNAKQNLARQHSDELVKFIATIDWHKPGMPVAKNILNDELSSKKVFDAISFVKSEIDSLIQERQSAEEVLRESEARYRLLVQHAKAGFMEYDYETNCITGINDEFILMSGYSEPELLGMAPIKLITESSQKLYKKRLSQIISGQPVSQDVVYQCIRKNGDIWWALLNINITYHNNRPKKASVVVSDITKLKETENKLLEYQEKLKRLSIRSSMIEEDQRRSMASYLHETIGQELFVMQLQLNAFEKSIDNPVLLPPLKQIREQLMKIMKETKHLTFELSPPVLYDFGFQEAVKALAETVQLKHNIRVQTFFEGDMDAFDNDIKVILYRNIKELIHNAVKHADAEKITIRLENSQSTLWVELRDNGVGFDTAGFNYETSSHDGFGLFDIREKLNHLGGSLMIDSAPGQGTSITMQVPLTLSK